MKLHNISFDVEDQVLKDLLTTALEGGSGYWASFSNIVRDEDLNVLSATVCDDEADDDDRVEHRITWEKMAEGLQRLAQPPVKGFKDPAVAMRHFTDALYNHDACTADVVLQMALFGEVIYG